MLDLLPRPSYRHPMESTFARISAEEAYERTLALPEARWPGRSETRISPIATPLLAPTFTVPPGASVFTIGSCFARSFEIVLRDRGMRIPTFDLQFPPHELMRNTHFRTGILNKYTPFSILNEIEQVTRDDDGARFLVDVGGGAWWDGQLHSHEPVGRERGLQRRRRIRRLYSEAITASPLVIVILGLAEAWWDDQEQLYLNETLPQPIAALHPGRFFFETLSIDKTADAVTRLVTALHELNPAQKMLLIVSPSPLRRSFTGTDAFVGNGYSKAALRVAAEIATRRFDHVDYFPMYEAVTLSPPDETWKDDLVHVQDDMLAHNVARMIDAYMPVAGT